MRLARLPVAALAAGLAGQAFAACPIELAVYGDVQGAASVEFTPTREGAAVTNTFRMLLEKDVVFDGVVVWSEGESRPFGIVTYKCPEGDVTGDEIAACTVWEGVIYGLDDQGKVALLPAEGAAAPKALIFAGLGHGVRAAPAYAVAGLSKTPWDVFEMKGCQE